MGFRLAYLKRAVLMAVVLCAVVFPAPAQRAKSRPGQPILFSSPANENVFSNMPTLAPKPPELPGFGDTLQAPTAFGFDRPPADIPLPVGAPVISRAEAVRMQDQLDKRKNWTLMTPAEILGATTPEKVMGIQERDATGRPKNLTALERYNERQNQALPGNPNTNALSIWISPDKQSDPLNFISGGLVNSNAMTGLLFNPAPDNQIAPGQNENSSWTRLFDSSPPPAAAPPQQTSMERFRQLLKSGSSPAAAIPALNNTKTPLPQTALSSGLGQSALTPVGASFTPLNSGIGKPAEMPKLPSIWGLSLTSAPSAAVWAPQPPPWLAPTPQPFAIPQRKF
jgi:hypothetical protein